MNPPNTIASDTLVETIARGWQGFKAEFVDTGRPAANDGAGSFLASLRSGP